MRKYNYFDDDDSAISDVRDRVRAADPAPVHDTVEIGDALRAFSRSRGEKVITVARNVLSKNPFEELENASKRKKRTVSFSMFFVFIVFLVVLVLATVHSVNKENDRIAKFSADAGAVCTQYLVQYGNTNYENLYSRYGVEGYRMTGLCYAREVDFDRDGTSELLLAFNDSGEYYTEVWGYVHGKFSVMFHEKATQTKKKAGDAWITVYSKSNRYYIGLHDEDDIEKVSLYGLHGDKFEKDYTCTYDKTAEAFSVRKKVDAASFERIKLAVLSEQKASVTLNLVLSTVDGFSADGGDASVKAAAINSSLEGSYYRIVEELNQKYGFAKYVESNGLAYIDGLAVVDLVDFNGDGTDELVVIYRKTVKSRTEDYMGNYISTEESKYYIEVYRYNGSGAVLAYKGEGISNSLNDTDEQYYILKTENGRFFYCQNSFSVSDYGRSVSASSTIMKFNKTTLVPTFSASYHSEYGYTQYYLEDKSVYKNEFDAEAYKVPFFDGSDSYDDGQFVVNYLQRGSRDSGTVEGQVEKTVSTIKKLNSSYDPE